MIFAYLNSMIIKAKFLIPRGYLGITIFPFIILLNDYCCRDLVLINHERIHLKQQLELLVILFYVWYGVEFLIKLIIYRNRDLAYHNISFEREAYDNDTNLLYIQKRPNWAFLKYLFR